MTGPRVSAAALPALAGFGLLSFVALSAAAQSEPPARVFTGSESVTAVEIPVHVLVGEEPLRGLEARDFEVREGRTRHPIVGFEVVDLTALDPLASGAQEPRPAAVAAAARRHFLFLFDLAHAEPSQLARARRAAREVVATRLHPLDLVAVAVYTASQGPRLVLSFTSDREQALLAVDSLGLPQLVDRSPEPLSLVLGRARADLGALVGLPGPSSGARNASEAPNFREEFERMFVAQLADIAAVEQRSVQVEASVRASAYARAFADLARLMRSVAGRKVVLLFSQGFDSTLLLGEAPGERRATSDLPAPTQPAEGTVARGDAEIGADFDAVRRTDSDRLYGSTRVLNDLEQMLEEFRRADCTIDAVDIGGVRAAGGAEEPPRASGEEALFRMADGTGGRLYRNFNDLGEPLRRSLARTAVTYLLTIQPPRLADDGAYHPIEVRLARRVPGATVRHRPGYFAPPPGGVRAKVQEKLELASLIVGGEPGGQIGGALAAIPLLPAGAKTRVPVVVEVAGAALLHDHAVPLLTTEVYAYAFGRGGEVGDFFAQQVGLSLPKVEKRLRAAGLKVYGELELAPGGYDLRVLVRNAQTGRHGLLALAVEVPDLAAAAPRLLAPLFVDDASRWVVAQAASRSGRPYPFTLGGEPFLPPVAPELSAAGGARCWMLASDVDAAAPLEVRVLGADGSPRRGGRLARAERAPWTSDAAEGAAGIELLVADFLPEGLAPGAYLLELATAARDGAAVASPAVPFRVVGR